MLGESKYNILQHLPQEYLPATVFVPKGTSWNETIERINALGITYPMIAKPDVGERGFRVVKIENEGMLKGYHASSPWDFLVQEFIDLPLEVSILYYRFPGHARGAITSVCLKEYLHVTGDGASSVRELMKADERANLQLARFEAGSPDLLRKIPTAGERLLLEPIGNHCRGTKFMSGNHLIDPELTSVFDRIGAGMEGIFYGRFDLKCESMEAMRKGNGFRILEFNGVSSDPVHIYDARIPVSEKYRDVYRHWDIMYRIYLVQRKNGVEAMDFNTAWRMWRDYRRYMKREKYV